MQAFCLTVCTFTCNLIVREGGDLESLPPQHPVTNSICLVSNSISVWTFPTPDVCCSVCIAASPWQRENRMLEIQEGPGRMKPYPPPASREGPANLYVKLRDMGTSDQRGSEDTLAMGDIYCV